MDFDLSAQRRMMVDSVRQLAQGKFKQDGLKYMDGSFPWDNIHDLARLGVLGMAVPEQYGGLGLPVLDTAIILEEISKACYVTAMAVLGEAGVQTRVIATYAPASIKERILPKVTTGECILAICMTEPHAGTDVANYRTNTVVKSDRLVLNGTKCLISRAPEASMFVIFSRINGAPGREGIGCVLLEPNTKGFSITGTYHTMGGENLHEVQFENCELPLENLVIREDGFKKLLTAFNTQRCLNPSISLGLAEGAFDEAVKYVKERQIFGQSVGDFQGIRWKFADMYRSIEASRGLLYRACASANPFPDPLLSALAKITCNETGIAVTSEAIQVHGGYGYTDEYLVSRLYRGARYGTLGGGATETLKDLIGKRVLAEGDNPDGIMGLMSWN